MMMMMAIMDGVDDTSTIINAVVLGGVILLFVSYYFLLKKTKKKTRPSLERSWSYTSEGMRIGCFPESIHAPVTVINVAIYFDNGLLPSNEDIATYIVEPLLEYERFKLIPSDDGLRKSTNEKYKAKDLIRNISISSSSPSTAATGNKSEEEEDLLHNAIIESLSYKLDEGRNDLPWWEIVRIENNNNKANKAAGSCSSSSSACCVLRVHHCLGDGLSLVRIFDQILTTEDGSKIESKVTNALLNKQSSSVGSTTTTTTTSSSSSSSSSKGSNANIKRQQQPSLLTILGAIGHVLGLPASKHDDPTPFRPSPKNMDYSGHRSYVYLPNIPLSFVKQLKNKAKVSVNDILMYAVSQSVHEYCQSIVEEEGQGGEDNNNIKNNNKNDDDDKVKTIWKEKSTNIQCRALLPASLPRTSSELKYTPIQNKWCMVSADMHVGATKPIDRLKAIHETTKVIKSTPRAYIQLWVQNNIGPILGTKLGQQATNDVFERHSMVLTNVPGPERIVQFAKKSVSKVHMLFPNIIPQISLLTYAGQVYGNIVYDPNEMIGGGKAIPQLYVKALQDLATELDVEIPTELSK